MQAAQAEMTKADFARHMNVSRAAVSQWISKGIIKPDALAGEGRKAKIIVAVAVEHVRQNRDIGQSLGNGIETRTSAEAQAEQLPLAQREPEPEPLQTQAELTPAHSVDVVPEQLPESSSPPHKDSVEDQLKRAKLQAQQFQNRRLAEDEALRRGILMSSDDAREQMTRIAGMMMQIFEGALPEIATAIAGKFQVPHRDVLHLIRTEFTKVRKTAAMKEQARAVEARKEATVEAELEI